jgi:dihydrofolate reductase
MAQGPANVETGRRLNILLIPKACFWRDLRKLVVLTFLTLDGVMQAPGGPEEDSTGVFKWGGWSAGYWDDALGKVMGDQMGHPYDLLLGRKTYEIFAAHWPHSTDPGAESLNNARKYVASKTLKRLDWKNSTLLGPDIVTEIQKTQGSKRARDTSARQQQSHPDIIET